MLLMVENLFVCQNTRVGLGQQCVHHHAKMEVVGACWAMSWTILEMPSLSSSMPGLLIRMANGSPSGSFRLTPSALPEGC